MTARADEWIRRTTIGCVAVLAAIAGTVSYLHMHLLVEEYGQPGWVAALTPLSVDGMIVAASTALLAESRSGNRGGLLPWTLLVIGSVASLAANVAVAEPTATGRDHRSQLVFLTERGAAVPPVTHAAAEREERRWVQLTSPAEFEALRASLLQLLAGLKEQ